MFTGIIAEVGRVISLEPDKLTVKAVQILKGIVPGASIAVNGACLTVTQYTYERFTVGLSTETLTRTNLGYLKTGDPVNLERPLGLGGELGGHLVQGHVDGTGRITAIMPAGGSEVFRFEAPWDIMRYIVEKGFIAIDGISLTVTSRTDNFFEVAVIDYTRAQTNLKFRKIGDIVNLEIDILAKYVERFMQARSGHLTEEYLKEHGF